MVNIVLGFVSYIYLILKIIFHFSPHILKFSFVGDGKQVCFYFVSPVLIGAVADEGFLFYYKIINLFITLTGWINTAFIGIVQHFTHKFPSAPFLTICFFFYCLFYFFVPLSYIFIYLIIYRDSQNCTGTQQLVLRSQTEYRLILHSLGFLLSRKMRAFF